MIGRCGHHVSANSKVKQQRESIICCCTFTLSNRELLNGHIVYLYRWRRGAVLIERLSGIDEGADGLWPLALRRQQKTEEGEKTSVTTPQQETSTELPQALRL